MTTRGFVVSHAKDALFERGLRSFHEGHGRVRLEAGSCVHEPPKMRHREVGHSEDIEMLEVALPASFKTDEPPSVDG